MKHSPDDILVAFGGAIKALETKPDGTVGGYLVTYTDETKPDLTGEWFTKSTYFGAHKGDGMDCMVHHGLPLHPALAKLQAEKKFALPPMKVTPDEVGLFAEVVLDLADAYQSAVYDLVVKGALGWSSGSSPHMAEVLASGEIKAWPIIEGSLTPTPCSPELTNKVMPLKSLLEIPMPEATEATAAAPPAAPVAKAASTPAVKSDYFHNLLEGNMTLSAFNSLTSALWGKLYDAVVSIENENATVAEAASKLQPVLVEFSEYVVKVFVSLMALKEAAVEDGDAIAVKSFLKSYPTQEAFTEAIVDDYVKASNVLNKKNLERTTSIIKAAQEMLDEHNSKKVDPEESATKSESDAPALTSFETEALATLKLIAEQTKPAPVKTEPVKTEPAAAPATETAAAEPAAPATEAQAEVPAEPAIKTVEFNDDMLNSILAKY